MSNFGILIALFSLCLLRIAANPICSNEYIAKEGDTCMIIGWNYGINQLELARMNPQLNCENLQPGMLICVSSTLNRSKSVVYTNAERNKFWDKFFGLSGPTKVGEYNKFTDSLMDFVS